MISKSYENFCYIAVSMIADGEGGQISVKNEIEEFKAAVREDQSVETEIAKKSAKNVTYTITTPKNIILKFNDLIRRKSDGKIFRITSDSRITPKISGLDLRQVTAEERT